MSKSSVTIYHNPRCSKSRQTLALLEERGIEPQVVEYLDTPPDAATLRTVLDKLGLGPRDIMRRKEAKEVGIADLDGDSAARPSRCSKSSNPRSSSRRASPRPCARSRRAAAAAAPRATAVRPARSCG